MRLICPRCETPIGGFGAKWQWFWHRDRACRSCSAAIEAPAWLRVLGWMWTSFAAFPIFLIAVFFGTWGFFGAVAFTILTDVLIVAIARPLPVSGSPPPPLPSR